MRKPGETIHITQYKLEDAEHKPKPPREWLQIIVLILQKFVNSIKRTFTLSFCIMMFFMWYMNERQIKSWQSVEEVAVVEIEEYPYEELEVVVERNKSIPFYSTTADTSWGVRTISDSMSTGWRYVMFSYGDTIKPMIISNNATNLTAHKFMSFGTTHSDSLIKGDCLSDSLVTYATYPISSNRQKLIRRLY